MKHVYKTDMIFTCPRCGRDMDGWPLKRADLCATKQWTGCLRHPEAALRKLFGKQESGKRLTKGERLLAEQWARFTYRDQP